MWNFIFFVAVLVLKIDCYSPKDVADQYKPQIQSLSDKISNLLIEINEKQQFIQSLIQKNIAETKVDTNSKITEFKKMINEAKLDALAGPLTILTCINQESVQAAKLYTTTNFAQCYPTKNEFKQLKGIKSKLVQLGGVVGGLSSPCQFLNPLQREEKRLKLCISSKLKEINLQVVLIKQEFDSVINNMLSLSYKCVKNESNLINRDLHVIMDNVRYCKNLKLC